MMRKCSSAWLAGACLLAWGCGPATPAPIARYAAPHGGVIFDFPNKKGCVEIVSEPAKDAAGASKINTHQIAAYFFQVDGHTPLSPSPTDVKMTMGDSSSIPLTPQDGPVKVGRFASAPGAYGDELRGILGATVDGVPVEIPFSKR